MRPPRQPELFDTEERAAQLTEMGDTFVGLNARIDWEAFRPVADTRVDSQICEKAPVASP